MINLFKRKVIAYIDCGLCDLAAESITHVLLFCKNARKMRALTPFLEIIQFRNWSMLWDFVEYAVAVLSKVDFQLLIMIIWGIWRARNNLLYEQIVQSGNVIAHAQGS